MVGAREANRSDQSINDATRGAKNGAAIDDDADAIARRKSSTKHLNTEEHQDVRNLVPNIMILVHL